MKCKARLLLACGFAAFSLGFVFTLHATGQKPTLTEVLAKMDQASRSLRSLEADIERTKVTVVVNDRVVETGKVYVARSGSSPRRVKIEFTKPAQQSVLIDKGLLRVFNHGQKRVDERKVSREDQDTAECVLLGLCQSADNLKKFEAAVIGEEPVDGLNAAVLDLKPKTPDIGRNFSAIRLWLHPEHWIAVQLRVTEANGDYQTVKLTNLRWNRGVSNSVFNLKLPKDVRVNKL